MAIIPSIEHRQGTLNVGTNSLVGAPSGYRTTVSLRFNNPVAYDITITIIRRSSASTLNVYSITLDAGDTVDDTGYTLDPHDSIQVSTTTPGTNYFLTINNIPYYATA
jgi:hypothetical protein